MKAGASVPEAQCTHCCHCCTFLSARCVAAIFTRGSAVNASKRGDLVTTADFEGASVVPDGKLMICTTNDARDLDLWEFWEVFIITEYRTPDVYRHQHHRTHV